MGNWRTKSNNVFSEHGYKGKGKGRARVWKKNNLTIKYQKPNKYVGEPVGWLFFEGSTMLKVPFLAKYTPLYKSKKKTYVRQLTESNMSFLDSCLRTLESYGIDALEQNLIDMKIIEKV